jgi:uncharacterized protein
MKADVKKKSWSLLETAKENKYFFDQKLKKIQLCHPLLYLMLKLYSNGINIKNRLDTLPSNEGSVEIPNCGKYSKEEIEYYYGKFMFLKENGYFSESQQEEQLSANLDAETIKYFLANTGQVIFEVTDKCNCNCRYCWFGDFYSYHDERKNENMDIQAAKNILHYLVELWNSPLNNSYDRIIYLTFYGGEPLLNFPFIKEIVAYVNQSKPLRNRFAFAITTNGILLHKYMDFLFENNFDLLVSLDGNEQNNAYRISGNGKPIFQTIMENVNALQNKYPGYFSTNVNFVSVLHNRNSVSEIFHFFKEHFDKIPHIGPLNPLGVKETQKKDFWKTYANLTQSLHETEDYSVIEKDMFTMLPKAQDATIFLHRYNDFCFHDYNDLLYPAGNTNRTPTGTCAPFSKKIFVSVNGKILPCERIGQQFGLGSVTPKGVELNFEKIAEKYNRYYNKIRQQCNNCSNADICTQCMFNIPSIDENKPECAGFMTETEFAKYISSIIESFEDAPETYSKILREVVI